MSNEASKNPKASKAAAILFSISGLLFIIVFAIGSNVAYLPVGIALIIISIVLWHQSRKLANGVDKKED